MRFVETLALILAFVGVVINSQSVVLIALTVFFNTLFCHWYFSLREAEFVEFGNKLIDGWQNYQSTHNKHKRGYIQMALVLTDEQKVPLVLAPKTAAGNPAALDGAPVWTVSDETVLELTVSEDGLSASVAAKGLGSAQVLVVADADLDEGETREISGVLDIVVVAAEAASLGISAGVPEAK